MGSDEEIGECGDGDEGDQAAEPGVIPVEGRKGDGPATAGGEPDTEGDECKAEDEDCRKKDEAEDSEVRIVEFSARHVRE